MARSQVPVKSKTIMVQSGVNVGGLVPGQIAEVDDTEQSRGLVTAGLWTLIVSKKDREEAVEALTTVESTEELDGSTAGDSEA